MNELITYAKVLLADDEVSPFELGFRLNDCFLSAIATEESRHYGKPREASRAWVAESKAP
jgi:hypothetical protein